MSSEGGKQKKKGGLDLYIIRHGEKTDDGERLTKEGKEQSRFIAKRIKKYNIKKVFSSDLTRCMDTADYIKKETGARIIPAKELREVRGFLKMKDPRFLEDYRRVKKFYHQIKKLKGKVLLVSSGNVNRILFSLILNIDPRKARFLQIPTALAHIEEVEDGKFVVVSLNDVSHLPERLRIRQGY